MKMGLCRAGLYKLKKIKGTEEEDFQNLDELLHLHLEFPLNGGVIRGSPEILNKGFLIERKPYW